MRLFIAIDLPEEIKARLSLLRRDLPDVRWVPAAQLHLTLHFLGEVSDEQLVRLDEALTRVKGTSFMLNLSKTGCFPHSRNPKVLWVGLENCPELYQLAKRIGSSATSCGVQLEFRPFNPHITLARIKRPESCNVGEYLNQHISNMFPQIAVREYVLIQSILTQQGAIHRPLKRYHLTGLPEAASPSP